MAVENSCLYDSERVCSRGEPCWTLGSHQLGEGENPVFFAFEL